MAVSWSHVETEARLRGQVDSLESESTMTMHSCNPPVSPKLAMRLRLLAVKRNYTRTEDTTRDCFCFVRLGIDCSCLTLRAGAMAMLVLCENLRCH
jgi:hypothetical protein